jgi:hypothetical protein
MINLASSSFVYFYPHGNEQLPKDSCEQVADFCLWFVRDLSQAVVTHENTLMFSVQSQATNMWLLWAFLGYTLFLIMTLIGHIALYGSDSHHQTYQKYEEYRFELWGKGLCELAQDESEQTQDDPRTIYDYLEKGVAHFSIEKVQTYLKDMVTDSFGPVPALMRLFNAWGGYGSLEQIFLAAAEKPDNIRRLFQGCESDETLKRLLQFFLDHDRDDKMAAILIEQLVAHATNLAADAGIDETIPPELKQRCLQGLFYLHEKLGDERVQSIIASNPTAFDGYIFLDSPELRRTNNTWNLFATAFEGAQAKNGSTLKEWREEMTPELMRLAVKNSFEMVANTLNSDCTSVPFYQSLITVLTEPEFSSELERIVTRPFSDEALNTLMYHCFVLEPDSTQQFSTFYGALQDDMSRRVATWCADSFFFDADGLIFESFGKLEKARCKQMLAQIVEAEETPALKAWFTQFLKGHESKYEEILAQCDDLPDLANAVRVLK